ncbi:MAG: porin family protein [SAR324 cluster bacterium]|nr:porin family protein [SAR324 cluster bacterium]
MPNFRYISLLTVFIISLQAAAIAQTSQNVTSSAAAESTKSELISPPQPGTSTAGPEGSEIASDENLFQEKKVGIGLSFGQILLTGDDAKSETGFNDAIGQGVFLIYRYRERLNIALKFLSSQHEGRRSSTGNLKRSQVTTQLEYFLDRGIFSPYGIVGAGIYFSDFNPSTEEKQAGISSSSVNTFGVLVGAGVDFEIDKNFTLGLSAIRHQSFKSQNSEREVNEAEPLHMIAMSAKTFF